MFLEASVYAVKRLAPDQRHKRYGLLVLVMRQWPRGIPKSLIHMWVKDAAPSQETLTALRQGLLSTDEFAQFYEAEQQTLTSCRVTSYVTVRPDSEARVVMTLTYPTSPLAHLRHLERLHGTITLLCWEPEPPCHRFLLLRWLGANQKQQEEAILCTSVASPGIGEQPR